MTDRELLEMAAKAAGRDLPHWVEENSDMDSDHYGEPCLCGDSGGKPYEIRSWNPLIDDGDAFRLAVKLNMDIVVDTGEDGPYVSACASWDDAPDPVSLSFETEDQALTATRRAVCEFAASIGRAMK